MSGVKRTRYDWFENLCQWIRDSGGSVSERLSVDEDRNLFLAGDAVPQSFVLMTIPFQTLINPDCLVLKGEVTTSNSLADCIIASYLATKPAEIAPYLESLPSSIRLVRHWSDKEIKRLEPSPLVNRISSSRSDIQQDFNHMRDALKGSFVYASFDQGMAAVSSRAFDHNGSPTMIPLLDLCNHARGAESKKNISYEFCEAEATVVVKTTEEIRTGTVFRITYGAQGNAPLLLNYGFCLEPNLEPDGSSNDTYELLSRNTSVHLRAGPKAYSYGCFCSALDTFVDADSESGPNSQETDDMEAFLNEMEEGTEFGWDKEENEESDEDEQEFGNEYEVRALSKFAAKLAELRSQYREEASRARPAGRCSYSEILLRSELRTIFFYQTAVKAVQDELSLGSMMVDTPLFLSPEDKAELQAHAVELASAYLQIRHSGMF